jgi:hypothetical protein
MGLGQNKYEWVNKLGVPGSIGLGTSVANTTVQDVMPIPFACKLRAVKAIGLGKAGTAHPTLDLFKGSASIMSAVMTIAANDTVYSGTLASGTEYTEVASSGGTALAAGNILSLRAVTHATGGAIITPTLSMKFKSMAPWIGGRFIVIKMSLPGDVDLGTSLDHDTILAMAVLPFACRPIIAYFAAGYVAGTASKPTLDIQNGIAASSTTNSLLDAAVTCTTALTGYTGALVGAPTGIGTPNSGKLYNRGTVLTLRGVTCSSDGALKVPAATLVCRY